MSKASCSWGARARAAARKKPIMFFPLGVCWRRYATTREEQQMEAVGVGRRAVAIIIDMIVLGILGYVIAMFTGMRTPDGFNLVGGPAFLWFGIGLAYYVVMEVQTGGTLGKMALGMKVVKEDGAKLDWGASLIRNILRIVDGFFFYLVGAIVVWTSKKRQRLGDMVAHTLVVRK
jgi:uncharacterized RDD family membrane protein YckC